VIGDGPERLRLERQYPEAKFLGYHFGEDLARHLAAADVMVFPSRTDTFGLVNLEAMACGVPVAAYPVSGPIDVVDDGVTGALDHDLATAARRALGVAPEACRARALISGWDVCSHEFESNLEKSEVLLQPKLILASRLVRESALDNASSSSIRPSRTRL
jgi:glycosyltransferase involved in cell wall biosynthesis